MVGKALAGLGSGALGLLIALRLIDGSYTALVQGWYEPVLLVTAAALIALGALASIQAAREGNTSPRPRLTAGAFGIIALAAIPVVIGFAYEPRPLGSDSLETLEGDGRSSLQFSSTAASSDPSQRNVYQWAYEFANTDPAEILGDDVNIKGFVYHPDDAEEHIFEVARFVVACCVADARGYTLPVSWDGAAELPSDQWVDISGRIGTGPDGSPVVLADSVEHIEPPANPYIYP